MRTLPVTLVVRDKINVEKWDRCIADSVNGLPYVYAYFLDSMSPGWSALVAGDYRMVMPLTWKKKWGVKYLYQPAFIQQAGVFSDAVISSDQLDAFLNAAKMDFRFAEIFLNYLNVSAEGSPRHNYVLSLDNVYEITRAFYKTDLVKNLRAASKSQLAYSVGEAPVAIQHYQREYSARLPHVKSKHYDDFANACAMATVRDAIVVRSVTDEAEQLLSSAILIRDKRRLVLILSVTTSSGRKQHANHFLLDQLIKEFSGQSLILDFEGSDIAGIAHFYLNFGAVDQPYYFYRYNNLPVWIKLFKR